MTKKTKREKARKAAVREWTETPAENPRYKGATPADVGRALLRKKADADAPPVKSRM